MNRESPVANSHNRPGPSNRFERNRSPAPMRELVPSQEFNESVDHRAVSNFPADNFNQDIGEEASKNNNNRNRFKKKLTNRSKSVEAPVGPEEFVTFNRTIDEPLREKSYPTGNHKQNIGGIIGKIPFIENNAKVQVPSIIVTNETPKLNRPFLQRQNALNSQKAFTKSLGKKNSFCLETII